MSMRNVGAADAAIRILIGIALLMVAAVLNNRPFVALGAGALAVLVLGTGLTQSCPLYVALGFNTADAAKPGRQGQR